MLKDSVTIGEHLELLASAASSTDNMRTGVVCHVICQGSDTPEAMLHASFIAHFMELSIGKNTI